MIPKRFNFYVLSELYQWKIKQGRVKAFKEKTMILWTLSLPLLGPPKACVTIVPVIVVFCF